MSIEEAFKIIRNFLDEGIKSLKKNIAEIEEIDKKVELYLNPNIISPDEIILKKKSDIAKYIEYRDKAHKGSLESKEKIEKLYEFREHFGKAHLLKKVIDFEAFLINLNKTNFVLEFPIDNDTIAKIIGHAIYNNNAIYEKSRKELNKDLNHQNELQREECQIVRNLKPYFNAQGEVIANQDVFLFREYIFELFTLYPDREKVKEIPEDKEFSIFMLINLLTEHLLEANQKQVKVEGVKPIIKPVLTKKEKREIEEQRRLNEQELATYFDGEQILRACPNLEEFRILVDACNLSTEDKKRIKTKMQTFLNSNSSLEKISFLSMEEQEIYKLALEKQLGNTQVKELIKEIHTLLEMNYEEISTEDKIFIENEVKDIINRMKYILNIATLYMKK